MQRDQPNWVPFIIGGSFSEGIGLIVVILATQSESNQTPVAMLGAGIALLALGGFLTMIGIFRMATAKKGR